MELEAQQPEDLLFSIRRAVVWRTLRDIGGGEPQMTFAKGEQGV